MERDLKKLRKSNESISEDALERVDYYINFIVEQNKFGKIKNALYFIDDDIYYWSIRAVDDLDEDDATFGDDLDEEEIEYIKKFPKDLTLSEKAKMYKEYENRNNRMFNHRVDSIFLYKQMSDLLKYKIYEDPFKDSDDNPMEYIVDKKWKKMRKSFHKGRIEGQMAITRLIEEASKDKYRSPKDIRQKLGKLTRTQGGGGKSKKKCKYCRQIHM